MRLRPIIGWAVFFFLAALIVRTVPSISGSFYFLKGKHLFVKGDYRGAATAYERAVGSDPKFARGYVELGSTYSALENYPKAEEAFKKAITVEEDSCAECGLGMVYRLQGRNEEAEKALKRAQELNPRDTCAFNELGRLYYDLEKYPEAIQAFRSEIKLRPTAVSYHFVGNAHGYLNEDTEALAAYREALRLNPKYVQIYLPLGHAANRLGRHAEAVEAYRRAIEAKPDDAEAHLGLAVTEVELGNIEVALNEYKILKRLEPAWAERLMMHIQLKEQQGQRSRKPVSRR
jgi:tetratricopeptide (TPR) repeat protein